MGEVEFIIRKLKQGERFISKPTKNRSNTEFVSIFSVPTNNLRKENLSVKNTLYWTIRIGTYKS